MFKHVGEQGGFFTDPDFCTANKAEHDRLVRLCAKDCKAAVADVRKAFKAMRHARSRLTHKVAELITEAEAEELAVEIENCKGARDMPFYPGANEGTQCVYLKHPQGNKHFEKAAGHLQTHPTVQKAIEGARAIMKGMHPAGTKAARAWKATLQPIIPRQIFANVYKPGREHKAPWHRDVDTRLGSVILVLRGDDGDKVLLQGERKEVLQIAPKPGQAILMAKNVLHAVPHRDDRKVARIALVIWF